MGGDTDFAMKWFQENVMEFQNPVALSCVYTKEGQVMLMVAEQDNEYHWITILWTNYLNETGYQRLPKHEKYVAHSYPPLGVELSEPFWKFWK